jgi:hypothetical protein
LPLTYFKTVTLVLPARFQQVALNEFLAIKLCETFYNYVEALQADLHIWLRQHNYGRPLPDYRNQSHRAYAAEQ